MKCLVIDGSLRHGKLDGTAKTYQIGDEVELSKKEYARLTYMLKPVSAVIAEEKAREIISKACPDSGE